MSERKDQEDEDRAMMREVDEEQERKEGPGTDIQQWADPAMYEAEPITGPAVHVIGATPDPLGAIAAASGIYEGKVVRDRATLSDDERMSKWNDMMKTHLTAPLEYVDFHLLLEGVTRSFTHQLVRQRTAVYAQESLRFAVKEDLAGEAVEPPSLPPKGPKRDRWDGALRAVQEAYEGLVAEGMPAEDARGLLPHSVATRVHYKTNLRGLAEHAGNRLCTQAQFEWRGVFARILVAIREHNSGSIEPDGWQFETIAESDLFRPVCYKLGKCPFNASFDRNCSIRPRVEEGKFDEIEVKEWLADPTAARRG